MADAPLKTRFTNGIFNRYLIANVNTRLALLWTRIFLALRMTPTQVSLLSLTISLAAMPILALKPDDSMATAVAAILVYIGLLWDHSDGQVARAQGSGSQIGGLIDTVIDRIVEGGVLMTMGIGILRSEGRQAVPWDPWIILVVVSGAVFGQMFFRWMSVQNDLYKVRAELLAAQGDVNNLRLAARSDNVPGPRMLWVPFAFNRDFSLTFMIVLILLPSWFYGLLIFAVLHCVRGLEICYYGIRELQKGDHDVVANMLHRDYHK